MLHFHCTLSDLLKMWSFMKKYSQALFARFDSLFDKNLLEMFPERSHRGIKNNKGKYRFELEQIARALDSNSAVKVPAIMDVGCGFGVNLIMSKLLWEVEAVGLDRFDEFNDIHDREVGLRSVVIDRMKSIGVSVHELDIVSHPFNIEHDKYEVITNFDVIEHFPFSPIPFLKKIYDYLALGGTLLVGTPNQVHLRNRIRCLCGENTWEDFDYYISSKTFYGHVREFTPSEFRVICESISQRVSVHYSTYPLLYSASIANNKFIKSFYLLANYIIGKFPRLNYYMVGALIK